MEAEFRFALLDFGPPMDDNIINAIINSLENVIALGLNLSRTSKELYFGISVLSSDFTILYSESYIRKNYDLFNKTMKSLLKTSKTNSKVTVQKYKQLLCESIKRIFSVSQGKLKTDHFFNETKSIKIKIALVTKKVASIVTDLLASVSKKLFENVKNEKFKQVFKVVQILSESEEETCGVSELDPCIKWMTCIDRTYDLNSFFKNWFLRWRQKIQIKLSTDLDFKLQCKVDDSIVHPGLGLFDRNYSLGEEVRTNENSEFVYNLEIINRIPVKNIRPTFLFGVPRSIQATRNGSTWIETQMNLKLFKELCWEMIQSEEGLLTKSVKNEMTTFHFLTSDGCTLLMRDIATEELYLPRRLKSEPWSSDENVSPLIRNCIQNVELLDTYVPTNFSSGLYDNLKTHLIRKGQDKSLFGRFNPDAKLFGKKCGKNESRVPKKTLKDENCSQSRKRSKLNDEKEFENIHPALLPEEVVLKYRKKPPSVFNVPELSKNFNEEKQ